MVKPWRLGDPKGRVGPEGGMLPPQVIFMVCVVKRVEDSRINNAALEHLIGNSVVFRAVRWPWEVGRAQLPSFHIEGY